VSDGDGTRWLNAEEQVAWRAYLRGSRALEIALDLDLTAHGIGLPEYEIISMLSEAPDRQLRMSSLAALVQQSRSRLTHTAGRLERRGWVARLRSGDDGRGVLLSLTDAGQEAVEAMAREHVESVRRHLIDALTPHEVEVVGRAMAKVYREIKGVDPPPLPGT
jgi:DNA-binding MarR family transcriptional regulator